MNSHRKKLEFLENKIDKSFDELKRIFQDLVVRIYQYHEVNLDDVAQAAEQGLLSALGIRDGGIERPDFDTQEQKGHSNKFVVNRWLWVPRSELNVHLNLSHLLWVLSVRLLHRLRHCLGLYHLLHNRAL